MEEDKFDFETLIETQVECIARTLIGFLLVNRKVRFLSLSDFDIERIEKVFATKLYEDYNLVGKDFFIISNFCVMIREGLVREIKPFLHYQLTNLFPPRLPIYSSIIVKILGDRLITDKKPTLEEIEFHYDEFYNAYAKRYITHEGYSGEELKLFDDIIKNLTTMKIVAPTVSLACNLSRFHNIMSAYRYSWTVFLGDLMNGILKPDKEITKYFFGKNLPIPNDRTTTIENIKWLTAYKFPSLINVKDEQLFVSDTFFKNKMSILPYIIPLINFEYLPITYYHILTCSCLKCYTETN
jgi:hypothetical protein